MATRGMRIRVWIQRERVSRTNRNNVEKNFTPRHDASIKATNQMSDQNSKPQLSYVHPKLPECEKVLATFTKHKREYLSDQNSKYRLNYVHPKLPNYDEVLATFTEYIRDYLSDQNSKPRLSSVHPKLPDCNEVLATFTEYKREYLKIKSNDGTLPKFMGWFRK